MFTLFNYTIEEDGSGYSINRLTLAFRDTGLEKRFQKSYFESYMEVSRTCHLFAVFFYCMVGLWDIILIEPSRTQVWTWVMLTVSFIFLSGYASSYLALKYYTKFWKPLFSFYVLMTGTGFAIVTATSGPHYTIYNFVGIIFCLFFCYTFIRLTFIWALIAGNTIVIIQTIASAVFADPPPGIVLTDFFFMFGINLLGMMVCYSFELMARRDFMLNSLLKEERGKTKDMNIRLEQKVKERTRELRVSEEMFKSFFNQGNIGMAITAPDKGWLSVNKKICTMLGYSKDELKKMKWTEMTWPEDLEPDLIQFEKMVSGEIDGYEMEKRFITKNQSILSTHLTVSCLRHKDGSVDKILATIQDLSEQKQSKIENNKT